MPEKINSRFRTGFIVTSWIPLAAHLAMFQYIKQYDGWVKPDLDEAPSFYMARQVHGTFQNDPVAIRNLPHTGVEPLLWGSDFPHAEGTFPHSRRTVNELFAGVKLAQAAEMLGGTAVRLFDFDSSVLTTPV